MIYQAHFQNRVNSEQTAFLAQAEFDNSDEASRWATDVFERRKAEMPDGWCPMICIEGSPFFAVAAPEAEVQK